MSHAFAERLTQDAEAHELPFAQDLREAARHEEPDVREGYEDAYFSRFPFFVTFVPFVFTLSTC